MKVVIVGAGVAGVFTAIELIDNGYKGENITIVDKGNFIQNRYCFTNEWVECEVEDWESYDRPESQGGAWILAQRMKIVKIME